MKYKVGDKVYQIAVADTDAKRQVGLSKTDKLKKGQGLLMKFDSPGPWPIRMSDMSFPLDLIFIKDGKVLKIMHGKAGGKDIDPKKDYDSVLEVNFGDASSIKRGDEASEVGEKMEDGTVKMAEGGVKAAGPRHVLDEDGKVQGNLLGEERIFSRKDTAKLMRMAEKKEFKKLGKAMVEMIHRQDTQEPEYAEN